MTYLSQALGDVALARGPKEVDRCLMAELAGGLLPGLDPDLQQKPVVDLLVSRGGMGSEQLLEVARLKAQKGRMPVL